MYLICKTDCTDADVWAYLNLTPEVAQGLLSYRGIVHRVQEESPYDLRTLEFADELVQYSLDEPDGCEVVRGDGWRTCPEDWEDWRPLPTAYETLRATNDGINWWASPYNSGRDFGTSVLLTYEQLQQVADGDWPFDLAHPEGRPTCHACGEPLLDDEIDRLEDDDEDDEDDDLLDDDILDQF